MWVCLHGSVQMYMQMHTHAPHTSMYTYTLGFFVFGVFFSAKSRLGLQAMEIPDISITRWPLETREVHPVSHLQLGQDQEGLCSLLLCNMGLGLKFLFAKLLSVIVAKLQFQAFREREREKKRERDILFCDWYFTELSLYESVKRDSWGWLCSMGILHRRHTSRFHPFFIVYHVKPLLVHILLYFSSSFLSYTSQ